MKRLLLFITICISSVSFGQVPNYVPTNGLVGWWGFNGNANDESGNGNNGTVNGAALTTDRFGNSSSAYEFDGVDDWISVQNSSSLNPLEISFNLWILPLSDNLCLIAKKNHSNATNHSYTITHEEIWNGNKGLRSSWSNSDCNNTGSVVGWGNLDEVQNNNWTQITVTIDQLGNCKQYLDGILNYQFSQTTFTTCDNNSSVLAFGYHWATDPKWMSGKMDEIGIWNRVLDSCEVKDLYEGSLGNCCTPNPITSQPTDVTVPLNGTGMFSTSTSVASPTYQWQMNDGTGYTNLFNAGQFSGVDTDMLTVSNVTLGQTNTLFRCIVTENSNCSDTTDVAVLTVEDNTGLEELNQQISIYPNPTSTSFTITSKNSINSSFKLMNTQGKVVLTGKIESTEETVDISKLSKGQYNLVFEDESISPIFIIKN